MIKGLVIGHRDIGDGLLKALESISGSFEDIVFISNKGLSTDELSGKITAACNNNEVILFVDVYGGSCWQAAKKARLSRCHIITGVNLPMLISFVNKRRALSFDKLNTVLEKDGKRGIISE